MTLNDYSVSGGFTDTISGDKIVCYTNKPKEECFSSSVSSSFADSPDTVPFSFK